MRYGVLTDLHANLPALEAVLESMREAGVEEYLCLGDIVGYYPYPNEVLERLETLNCWKVVLGNHDAALLDRVPLTQFNEAAARALEWTKPRVKEKHIRFLERLRLQETIGDLFLVHASPFQSEQWHYLTRLEEIARNFRYFEEKICFIGHVHKPFAAEQTTSGDVRLLEGESWTLDPGARYLVSAGSVGQPRDGDPRAAWVFYDSEKRFLCVHRVPYDVETTIHATLSAGLPDALAQRLRTGR